MNGEMSSRVKQLCLSTSRKSNVLGLQGRHISEQYVLIAPLYESGRVHGHLHC